MAYFEALDSVTSVRVARQRAPKGLRESSIIAAARNRFQDYSTSGTTAIALETLLLEEIWL